MFLNHYWRLFLKTSVHAILPLLLITACDDVTGSMNDDNDENDNDEEFPTPEQIDFLDQLQEDTFNFFWETTNPENGLVPDRYPNPPSSSIAAVGFGLSSYIVGVERGYITRQQAAERTYNTVEFFYNAPMGPEPQGNAGYRGFFYHFLDMETGERAGQNEISTIDTSLLLAGMLSSQSYFDQDNEIENAIRTKVDSIYARMDWQWFYSDSHPPLVSMGWTPEDGKIQHDWRGYDESMILYILGLASPTHPVDPEAWEMYTETYHWDEFYGMAHVNASPLFLHQYSHMFVDFRDIQDDYMRGKGIDYFENSRLGTYSNRAYAIDNPMDWEGYSEDVWGLTACDGPGNETRTVDGEEREFRGYWARGASATHINDDGTIAPTAAGGSVPFAPEITIPTLHHFYKEYGERLYWEYGFRDSFNLTYTFGVGNHEGWFNRQFLGIDQGPILIQIENYRSEIIWDVMKENPYIHKGLEKAGFEGGWLDN